MYSVHDWAEVRRLHDVEGMSKSAIAEKLSLSRNTVSSLVAMATPPKYQRAPAGSQAATKRLRAQQNALHPAGWAACWGA